MASIVFLFISMFNTFPSKSPSFCISVLCFIALHLYSGWQPFCKLNQYSCLGNGLYCFAVKQQVRFPQVHLYTEEKWLPVLCLDDKCSVRTKFTKAHVGNIDHRLLPFLTYFLEKCKFLYNIQHYGSLLIFLICKKFASISKLK